MEKYDRSKVRMDKHVTRLRINMTKELMRAGIDVGDIGTASVIDRFMQYAYTVGFESCLDEWRNDAIPHPLGVGKDETVIAPER